MLGYYVYTPNNIIVRLFQTKQYGLPHTITAHVCKFGVKLVLKPSIDNHDHHVLRPPSTISSNEIE